MNAWKIIVKFFAEGGMDLTGEKFVPFDADSDYGEYVDGKPRPDGVRSFLTSRGIELPGGDPERVMYPIRSTTRCVS